MGIVYDLILFFVFGVLSILTNKRGEIYPFLVAIYEKDDNILCVMFVGRSILLSIFYEHSRAEHSGVGAHSRATTLGGMALSRMLQSRRRDSILSRKRASATCSFPVALGLTIASP